MSKAPHRLVVVGHGAAGLSAALAAAEAARQRDLPVDVTLVEKASEESPGGNTLWSPSYMRLAAPDPYRARFRARYVAGIERPRRPALKA
jgi:tricarballylate dehydrogenase